MRYSFLFVMMIAYLYCPAQNTIKGFVTDATNKTPVAGSSVFITNTSFGTVSDQNGYFEINNLPPGNYELVTSNVGYETAVYSFSAGTAPVQVRFLVRPKTEVMETVVVGGYITERWQKWGRIFLEYFIGLNDNSRKTVLKNHKVLQFRFYKNQNILKVVAREPLIIENSALGYKIVYDLQDFEINFKEHSNFYAGYTLFSDLKGTPSAISKWGRNREQAYQGSLMQFFRALYNDRLNEDGFAVRRMQRVPNIEKIRVRQLYKLLVDSAMRDPKRDRFLN
ncbi:MAG: carboxypeptidase-like regulatory domain-containing protein [Niabella sp.]